MMLEYNGGSFIKVWLQKFTDSSKSESFGHWKLFQFINGLKTWSWYVLEYFHVKNYKKGNIIIFHINIILIIFELLKIQKGSKFDLAFAFPKQI